MNIPFLYELPIWVTGLLIVGTLLVGMEAGFRLGERKMHAKPEGDAREESQLALTSILALLGLVLAFTYAFTLSRADLRKQAVIDEANAIGTAFLRAGLAPEPTRTELRIILRDYAKTRVVTRADVKTGEDLKKTLAHTLEIQSRIWPATERMVRDGYSGPIAASIVQSVNEVIDSHAKRIAVSFDRLPMVVFAMLLFISAVSMFLIGSASAGKKQISRWHFVILSVVLASVITVITDFDRGRSGFVHVSQQSLVDLIRDMDDTLSK